MIYGFGEAPGIEICPNAGRICRNAGQSKRRTDGYLPGRAVLRARAPSIFRCGPLLCDTVGFGQDAEDVPAEDLLDVGVGVALAHEGLGNFWKLGAVFHAVGHVGAIEVGAQADVIGTDKFHNMINVLDDFFPADTRQLAFGL